MPFPGSDYLQRVEILTDAIEEGSAAEVVVMIATRSGSYRDVDLTWAGLFAFATLLVLVFSPLEVSAAGLIPNLLIGFGLGAFVSRRSALLRRLLTTPRRRRQQVADAARLAFLGEALDAVPGRTGVLIYLSLLERDIEIVADHGLHAALGRAPLHAFKHAVRAAMDRNRLAVFLEAFEAFGNALRAEVPITDETRHGIPNRPRVMRES